MIGRIILWFLLAITLFPQISYAQAALFYTRSNIGIVRKNLPPAPLLPWQDKATPPQPQDPTISFDTEVRDGQTLYRQDGWYNLSSPEGNGGVLMLFSEPGNWPISHSPQYASFDILMISPEGIITQIVPNIQLSSLEKDIVPPSPVLALMFIKGGMCDQSSIRPGDSVEYKAFNKPPVVLVAPPAKENPPAAKPAPAQDVPPTDAPARNLSAPMMMEMK